MIQPIQPIIFIQHILLRLYGRRRENPYRASLTIIMACTSLSTLAFFCFFTIMLHEGLNEVWKPRLRCFSFTAYKYPCAIIGIEGLNEVWKPRLRCFSFTAYKYPCAIIGIERFQQQVFGVEKKAATSYPCFAFCVLSVINLLARCHKPFYRIL